MLSFERRSGGSGLLGVVRGVLVSEPRLEPELDPELELELELPRLVSGRTDEPEDDPRPEESLDPRLPEELLPEDDSTRERDRSWVLPRLTSGRPRFSLPVEL